MNLNRCCAFMRAFIWMMSALEEEMSADNCTTDGSNQNDTDNDASKDFLQTSSEAATTNQINYDVGNPTVFLKNAVSSSEGLASAAGAAVAAISEYHLSSNKSINKNSVDNTILSLTHHINNRQFSPSYQHQHQLSAVPVHLNDNTDNRSTASTMSDLSMADSSTNHRHQMPSSGSGNFNSRGRGLSSSLNHPCCCHIQDEYPQISNHQKGTKLIIWFGFKVEVHNRT